MSKNNKKVISYESVNEIRRSCRTLVENKVYNIFMDTFTIDGITPERNDYLMRQMYDKGTTSAFRLRRMTNEDDNQGIVFTPYTTQTYTIDDGASTILFINKRGNNIIDFIPNGEQVVGVDCVVGYIQPNHKPIKQMLNYYINRLVEVEMVINNNLIAHKMPILVGVSDEDKDKAEEIIMNLLNDKPVIFTNLKDLTNVKALVTGSEFLIDKLYSYKKSIENDMYTLLGIDNVMEQKSSQGLLVDQANANNQMINNNKNMYKRCLENFVDEINELYGTTLKVVCNREDVKSEYEETDSITSYKSKEISDHDND